MNVDIMSYLFIFKQDNTSVLLAGFLHHPNTAIRHKAFCALNELDAIAKKHFAPH